jgi:hypothetical protein
MLWRGQSRGRSEERRKTEDRRRKFMPANSPFETRRVRRSQRGQGDVKKPCALCESFVTLRGITNNPINQSTNQKMEKALIYEIIGTAILIIMGGGVVANSILKKSKAEGAGWVNITFGWGLGVFIAVIVAGPHSGAHINPAVTIGLATAGLFSLGQCARIHHCTGHRCISGGMHCIPGFQNPFRCHRQSRWETGGVFYHAGHPPQVLQHGF